MYSTESVNGFPVIQREGPGVLSVQGQDWKFANWLCEILNALSEAPKFRNEDCKWLVEMDLASGRKVQHV